MLNMLDIEHWTVVVSKPYQNRPVIELYSSIITKIGWKWNSILFYIRPVSYKISRYILYYSILDQCLTK